MSNLFPFVKKENLTEEQKQQIRDDPKRIMGNRVSMAGLVSLHQAGEKFGMPWKDFMIPVGERINALQRSVLECAMAGCDSIWISCNYDEAPYARKCVGQYIVDPERMMSNLVKYKWKKIRRIPIFFVPMNIVDIDERDSMAWGVVNAAINCINITKKTSHYLKPDKFYVSFVQGCYNPWVVVANGNRTKLKVKNCGNFYLEHDGKTVKDGSFLGFTFTRKELSEIRRDVYTKSTRKRTFLGDTENFIEQSEDYIARLPPEERNSSRNFGVDKVFSSVKLEPGSETRIAWYFPIETWAQYRDYMRSNRKLRFPRTRIFDLTAQLPLVGVFEEDPKIEIDEEAWKEFRKELEEDVRA